MKIQICMETKTIKLEDKVNFKKLMEFMESLPEETFGKYQDYTIEVNTKIEWTYYPRYIYSTPYPYISSPNWYSTGSITTYASTIGESAKLTSVNNNIKGLSQNIYNFEVSEN